MNKIKQNIDLHFENFNLHPTQKNKRWIVNRQQIFCNDPWSFMGTHINQMPVKKRPEIQSYLEQGKAFYLAGQSTDELSSKPLLFYYTFLNLAKACVIKAGTQITYSAAYHGINEIPLTDNILDVELSIHNSTSTAKPNILVDFWKTIYGNSIISVPKFKLGAILRQILPSHRVYCEIAEEQECFLPISKIEFVSNIANKEVWLQFEVSEKDFEHTKVKLKNFMELAEIDTIFSIESKIDNDKYIVSQKVKLKYRNQPQEKYDSIVYQVKQRIWQMILSVPPYRKYYLFLGKSHQPVLPQIISSYSVLFALSSIVRYRPMQILENYKYLPWLQEYLTTMPSQTLYAIAGEFLRTEISKPSII